MARKTKEKGSRKAKDKSPSSADTSRRSRIVETPRPIGTIEAIHTIAAYNARADLSDEYQLLLFLKSWWSKTYNRPLKDPILMSYSTEELMYEFYDRIERTLAEKEQTKQEDDKIDIEKEQVNLDWAEEEERKELEAMKRKKPGNKVKSKKVDNPTENPDNIKWMQEQLEKAKQVHGDTFGEDLEETFE